MPSLPRMTLEEIAARRRASRRRVPNVGLLERVGSAAAGVATGGPTRVHRAITIDRSPEDVYHARRDLAIRERVVERLEPGSTPTDIVTDIPNEMLEWRTGGSRGTVRFQRAPRERGTEVRLTVEPARDADVEDALLRLKALVEAGETPTRAGQPSGRRG